MLVLQEMGLLAVSASIHIFMLFSCLNVMFIFLESTCSIVCV